MANKTGDVPLTKDQINMNSDAPTSSITSSNTNEHVNGFNDMYKKLLDNQEKLNLQILEKIEKMGEKQDRRIKKKQKKVLDEFKSIRKEMNERKRSFEDVLAKNPAKKKIPWWTQIRKFIFRCNLKNVANMKNNEMMASEIQEYFGTRWKINIVRKAEQFLCCLHCMEPVEPGKKSIEIIYDLRIISKDLGCKNVISSRIFDGHQRCAWIKLIEWKDLEEKYLDRGNLTVECHIEIEKMTGMYKKNLREFDKTMEKFSDAV